MAEDDRADAEGAAPRDRKGGLGVHLRGGGIQPDTYPETAGQPGWCPMSQGEVCPRAGRRGQKGPQVESFSLFGSILELACLYFDLMRVADSARNRRFLQPASGELADFYFCCSFSFDTFCLSTMKVPVSTKLGSGENGFCAKLAVRDAGM